jgi:non-ribosomal peptide synthetase component E (peptide arylation enzyme)
VLLDDEVFSPDVVLDTIEREQVTGMFLPGPLLTPVLDAVETRPGFQHGLRRIVVFFGTPDLLDRTTKLLGPVWAHGFGSTEQGAVATRLLPHQVDQRRERINRVGRPASPFLEIAVVGEQGQKLGVGQAGEIVARSAMSLGGYWACRNAPRSHSSPATGFALLTSVTWMRTASCTTLAGPRMRSPLRVAPCTRTWQKRPSSAIPLSSCAAW